MGLPRPKPYAGLLQQLSSARTGEASVFKRTLVESSVYHLAGPAAALQFEAPERQETQERL